MRKFPILLFCIFATAGTLHSQYVADSTLLLSKRDMQEEPDLIIKLTLE